MTMGTITKKNQSKSSFYFLTLTFITCQVTGFSPTHPLIRVRYDRQDLTERYVSSTIPSSVTTNPWSDQNVLDDCSRIARWRRRTRNTFNSLFPNIKKKQVNKKLEFEDYERRKILWESQYCTLESLRELFGENRNEFWGDLDAKTARRLYKTLLPRALLEMYRVGIKPEDLAPLAYRARLAAKLYVRERSELPARVTAQILDGTRSFQQFGKFQTSGMTYPQIWNKYEREILNEMQDGITMDDDSVTAKICLKILERSCATNEKIDRWLLRGDEHTVESRVMLQEQMQDLSTVIYQLEQEVQEILEPTERTEAERRIARFKVLRTLVRARKRLDRWQSRDISSNI